MDFKSGAIFTASGFLVLGLLFLMLCTVKIDPGYAGVVYNMSGGVESDALSQGWHVVNPLKKVTEYPVSTETVYLSKDKKEGSRDDDSFFISTKDGKTVNVDVAYSYRMDFEKLPSVFTKFRGKTSDQIEDGYIRDRLKESCNVIATQMDVLEIYGDKRQALNDNVFNRFQTQLSEIGIILETFAFTRIEPDPKSMEAIQRRVDAKQKLEQMKIEKEQTIIMAEKKEIDTKAALDRERLAVENKAKLRILEAESIAKSNRIVSESITDKILEKAKIEKWNGVTPQVVGSEGVLYNIN